MWRKFKQSSYPLYNRQQELPLYMAFETLFLQMLPFLASFSFVSRTTFEQTLQTPSYILQQPEPIFLPAFP